MKKHGLEGVLIGNAAAAIHGAPVTTLDFDFMFRETPANMRKLKAVSRELKAVILRPYYPASKLYRMVDDSRGIQVDYMPVIHGIRSFASLRSRALRTESGGCALLLASLPDIIASKRAAGRLQDQAVIPVLERTLHETEATSETTTKENKPGERARGARGGK
ncbi:MAG TPA: hypothetical protein VGH65_08710 [Verrucomicrobiaceae bacterium]